MQVSPDAIGSHIDNAFVDAKRRADARSAMRHYRVPLAPVRRAGVARMQRPTFIGQVADRLRCDAHRPERITGIVFHELRDRLPEADAAHVARHLPTALRPLWIDNDRHPSAIEHLFQLEFLGDVMERGAFPTSIEAERAVVAVFVVLQRRLDRVTCNTRALSGIFGQLPQDLAVLWRAAEACGADVPRHRPARPLIAGRRVRAASRSSPER